MFSTPQLRVVSAKLRNPQNFQHITLMVDGHDSRALHNGADKPALYSYKLKKSGYRTQMCIDINGMILCLSDTEECRSNPDITMFRNMNLLRKIHTADCVVLDGGYPQSVLEDMVENTDDFKLSNFCIPIRKPRGANLTANELDYNKRLGSFRSMIESTFGDLGNMFKRLSNKDVVRIAGPKLYNTQMKLCCLLYNMKRMVTACQLPIQHHHTIWMQHEFDFPDNEAEATTRPDPIVSIAEKNELADDMADLQLKFLTASIEDSWDVYVEL
ncbi:hypothetical protein GGF41_002168 [Coemansia sp. RSA 2531]|nr:hypothetical protein GGF41_002168 [Coemansia sp. RSA 2531]